MIDRLGPLLEELKERRAVRFVLGYLVGAWVAAQIAGFFVEQGYVGRRFLDVTLFLAVVFFILTLVLVWYHGERGHQKVQRVEGVLIAALLLIAGGGSGWIATRSGAPDPAGAGAVYELGESSVAVLPFENQIMLSDFEWLDRGIAELLATDLSQFDTVRVVSGQRVFDILRQMGIEGARTVPRGRQTEVTRRAGARYMLTGSILGSPDDVQIVATLSDARTGEVRASSRARGSDVFSVVDSVSAAILSGLLGRNVLPVENAPVARLTTNSLEAFRAYDAGRNALWQYLNQEAREHFERAVALDSTYAAAHFQLAGLAFRSGDVARANRHLGAAARHLDEASERDRLAVGAFLDLGAGDTEEGERKFRELLRKYPDEKEARMLYAAFAGTGTAGEETVERMYEEILALDPFYAEVWNTLAYRASRRGDHAAADSLVERYMELLPDAPNPYDSRGEIREFAGRYEEARSDYRRALEIRGDFAISLAHLARSYAREGRFEEARAELAEYRGSEFGQTRVWAWWATADTRMWEGDVEGAVETYDSLVAVAATSGRPDLHAQAIDQVMRTLVLLERYGEASRWADSLRRVRGPDANTTAATMHYLASERRFDLAEEVARMSIEAMERFDVPEALVATVSTNLEALIEFHRGNYAGAVEAANSVQAEGFARFTQLGHPVIRSALQIGDAATARDRVAAMFGRSVVTEYRRDPLEGRYRSYYLARIAELEGDAEAALRGYDSLIDGWAAGLDRVPLFTDVRERRAALAKP